MAGMLTQAAINGFKEHTRADILKARYKVGGTYHDAVIQSKDYLSDGRLAVKILVEPPETGTVTVSEIQIYDVAGNLWLKKQENIVRESVSTGILYRFTFDFKEN